jgi:DNA transformation protein
MPADQFVDFLLDQLDAIDDVRAQRMFGGFGLYSGDVFFGIVHKDTLYFKVDDRNRNDYQNAGMGPFKPYGDRPMTMQYYQVPVAVVEDADDLCLWARRAIEAKGRRRKRRAGLAAS